MSTVGTRGKSAEDLVKKYCLNRAAKEAAFTYYRPPDARGGSLVVAPADFMLLYAGTFTLLEIKECQHDYRLPHNNFSSGQIARMRVWQEAGAVSWVAVRFMPKDVWRIAQVDYFLETEGGSWDMRKYPEHSLTEALEIIIRL